MHACWCSLGYVYLYNYSREMAPTHRVHDIFPAFADKSEGYPPQKNKKKEKTNVMWQNDCKTKYMWLYDWSAPCSCLASDQCRNFPTLGRLSQLFVLINVSGDLDWHSGESSIIPELPQEIRSRKKISGDAARICAQNFDTVRDMVVKLAGEAIFEHLFARAHEHVF